MLFVLCKKYFSFTPKYQEFKIQLLFGLPQILIGFSYYFIDWIDRYFINEYLSLSDVGIYSFGYKIGLLIHVGFVIPFTKIWVPIRSENLHSKNFKILNSKILTYFYLIGSIIVLFIILFLNEFLLIFSAGSDEYMKSKFVIPIIMFGHLFFGMINILDIGIFKSRKPMMSALALIIHIPINIILNIILVPKIGYYGAAISTLITYLSLAFLITYMSNRFYPVKYDIFNLTIITIISIFFSILAIQNFSFTGFIFIDKFILLFLLLVFYYYYFEKEIKNLLIK